jgi:DNA-binding NarL/FixJ family response regulator
LIKLCVIAPYEPLRLGLCRLIAEAPDMEVIAEASSLAELPGMGALREADILVLDSDAMLGTGRMTYDKLDEWLPALKVLFLGTRDDARNLSPDDLPAYMQLNTVGFMLKDGPTSRLVDGIRLIACGTFVCEMDLIRHMLTRLSHWAMLTDEQASGQQLSSREMEVLEMVVKGASNKEIAQDLFLSEGTVKAHVSHIMAKVNVERRTDLVRHALTKGMVRVAENGDNGYR